MQRPPHAPGLLQECRSNMSSGTVLVSSVNNHLWHRITSKLNCSSPLRHTVSLRVQDVWSVTLKPHIQRRGFSNDLGPTACFDFLGATFSLRFYPPSFARGSRHAPQNTHFTQRVRATRLRHEHPSDLPAGVPMKATGKSHGEAEARMGANRNEKVSLASESLSKHFRLVLPNQLDRVGRLVWKRGGGNIQRQLRVADGGGGPRAREVDQIKGITDCGLEDTSRSAL